VILVCGIQKSSQLRAQTPGLAKTSPGSL
jgi:hypothetical protein